MINLKGKKIKYFVKSVYGIDRLYLSDPREARNLQKLTKNETMSPEHMEALKELAGIEFEETLPEREMPM